MCFVDTVSNSDTPNWYAQMLRCVNIRYHIVINITHQLGFSFNILEPEQNIRHLQTTFEWDSISENLSILIKFPSKFVPRDPTDSK